MTIEEVYDHLGLPFDQEEVEIHDKFFVKALSKDKLHKIEALKNILSKGMVKKLIDTDKKIKSNEVNQEPIYVKVKTDCNSC